MERNKVGLFREKYRIRHQSAGYTILSRLVLFRKILSCPVPSFSSHDLVQSCSVQTLLFMDAALI